MFNKLNITSSIIMANRKPIICYLKKGSVVRSTDNSENPKAFQINDNVVINLEPFTTIIRYGTKYFYNNFVVLANNKSEYIDLMLYEKIANDANNEDELSTNFFAKDYKDFFILPKDTNIIIPKYLIPIRTSMNMECFVHGREIIILQAGTWIREYCAQYTYKDYELDAATEFMLDSESGDE
jgi:hypothetical protein